jgi:hypothetical protein
VYIWRSGFRRSRAGAQQTTRYRETIGLDHGRSRSTPNGLGAPRLIAFMVLRITATGGRLTICLRGSIDSGREP